MSQFYMLLAYLVHKVIILHSLWVSLHRRAGVGVGTSEGRPVSITTAKSTAYVLLLELKGITAVVVEM